MSRRQSVVLGAVLFAALAVAGIAGATGAGILQDNGQPQIIDVDNSSNYLSPTAENTTQERYGTAKIDVSAAIAADSKRLHGEQLVNIYDRRIIEGDDATDVARETADKISVATDRLEQRQQALYFAYSEGQLSETELFRELVRLQATANQYGRLSERAQNEPSLPPELLDRYESLDAETTMLPRPVTGQLLSALSGQREPTTVYVQSADDSLVLATVVDGIYLREATVNGQRSVSGTDQFATPGQSPEERARERASVLYPWTVDVDLTPQVTSINASSVYLFRSSHAHGEIRSFIDGGTRNVFHEVQFKNPIQVPVSDASTNTDNDIRLTVESTAATGPMRISLVSGEDIDPSQVTVSVNGQSIGTFDESGNLWGIQPRGSFEVTATTPEGDTVSVQVTVLES